MRCFRHNGTSTMPNIRPVTLDFSRDDLLHDIRTIAYAEGEVMTDDATNQRVTTQDIAEDCYADRVTRVMDLAFAECKDILYPYTKDDVQPIVIKNDDLKEKKVYTMHMFLPIEFSETTVELIKNCVHEYLVDKSLYDWLGITNPNASLKWAEKAEMVKDRIHEAVNFRTGRVRRTLSPF